MTKRFVFWDEAAKKLYSSPEFSGNQEECATKGGGWDSSNFSTKRLLELFKVRDLDTFTAACVHALECLQPAQDNCRTHPIFEMQPDQLSSIRADECVFIIRGRLVSVPVGWDGSVAGLCQHIDNALMIVRILLAQSAPQHIPTLEYRQILRLPTSELAIIHKYLNVMSAEEYQDEDDTIVHTVQFPDGMQMDIKCCGTQEGPSWAEAVLFDQYGQEVACSEVCETYEGSWTLPYGDVVYAVDVVQNGSMLVLSPIQTSEIDR